MLLRSKLFPLRFLGFGLFWGWFFLISISPSPLLGAPSGVGNIPFEMSELGARIVILMAFLAVSRRVVRTPKPSLAICAVGVASLAGACAAPLSIMLDSEMAVTLGSVLASFAETALFVGWMSLFGYMKLGETLLLLAASYGIGASVSLAAVLFGNVAMTALSIVLPLASFAALAMSLRFYQNNLVEEPESASTAKQGSSDEKPSSLFSSRPFMKMTVGFSLYSVAFALYLSIALSLSSQFSFGFVVEPVCAIALVCILAMFARLARNFTRPYALYRAVPPLFGTGFALIAIGFGQPLLAGALITLGYLLFEVLAYNDYCNIVKTDGVSLAKGIAAARLTNSVGLIVGWTVGHAAQPLIRNSSAEAAIAVMALLLVLFTTTLAFTDHDRHALASIADDRAMKEDLAGTSIDREELCRLFGESIGLSKREQDVLSLLLAGRTTAYAAEKLFVAESTVRAHVHNIYRKAEVHSRMELMDLYEQFSASAQK